MGQRKKPMSILSQLPISFVFIIVILLCGCAPVCKSQRAEPRSKIRKVRPTQTAPRANIAQTVAALQPLLRPGDIVFIGIPNPLFHHVADATNCPATHVGIAFNDPGQGWVVAESAVPLSKITRLDKFIAHSEGGWCTVRRLKEGLTEAQVRALRAECDARMGVLYHTGFRYESHRQFCSKFVYDVYLNALNVRVGKIETFSDLLDRNPKAGVFVWKCWFLGRIPWNRLTVTPASQYESPLLETVWPPA